MKHIDLDTFTVVRKGKKQPTHGGFALILHVHKTYTQGTLSASLARAINSRRVTFLVNGTQVAVRASREDENGYAVSGDHQFAASKLAEAIGIDRHKIRGPIRIPMEPTQTDAWVGEYAASESMEAQA